MANEQVVPEFEGFGSRKGSGGNGMVGETGISGVRSPTMTGPMGSGAVGASGSMDVYQPIENFEEVYAKMRDPELGLNIGDRRWRLITYAKCFVGNEAVTWMVDNLGLSFREEAVRIGQKLMEAGVIHHVTNSEQFEDQHFFYRFQEDEESKILNMKRVWLADVATRPAGEVAQELITTLASVVEEFRIRRLRSSTGSTPNSPFLSNLPPDSGEFDYSILRESEQFRAYIFAAAELQKVDLSTMDHDEKMAFFVNIYNALCMHCHIVVGPPTNFFKRWIFFRTYSYRIAGLDYSLDDIEHGILRGNKKPPSIKLMQQLGYNDPKCEHILKERDGRVHFVISAGTQSDPAVRILEADNLEEELHEATSEFLRRTVKIDVQRKTLTLPRIFSWYGDDFPQPEVRMIRFIEQYLTSSQQGDLNVLMRVTDAPTIVYENFNWQNPEARFEAAVIRRKRRRIARELDQASDSAFASPYLSDTRVDASLLTPKVQDPEERQSRLQMSPLMAETIIGIGGDPTGGITGPDGSQSCPVTPRLEDPKQGRYSSHGRGDGPQLPEETRMHPPSPRSSSNH